jgi:hypothetical protein
MRSAPASDRARSAGQPSQSSTGSSEVKTVGERVYILFDRSGGARRGLLDVRLERGNKLIGRYINLTDPTIIAPWVGLIVNNQRIDGQLTRGRLDLRK